MRSYGQAESVADDLPALLRTANLQSLKCQLALTSEAGCVAPLNVIVAGG
jgi:hypothetical protein